MEVVSEREGEREGWREIREGRVGALYQSSCHCPSLPLEASIPSEPCLAACGDSPKNGLVLVFAYEREERRRERERCCDKNICVGFA